MPSPVKSRSESGFSLMEAVVALCIVAFIMLGSLTILDSARQTTSRTMGIASAQQSGSFAMQELATTVKRAGFMLGKRTALLKSNLVNGVQYISTWNNYNSASYPNGIWSLVPAGGRVYAPVPGTDGITVRFSNDKPPISVCVMPSGNGARIELAYDPTQTYPVQGDEVDFITSAPCPGYSDPNNEAYLVHVTVRQDPGANNPGGNCSCAGQNCNLNSTDSCVAVDPVCNRLYTNRFNACYKIIIDNIGCDLCAVGPTYMISATSASYWVSTEDGTGNIAASRPILVGREGLGSLPTRVISTDIEDMQLAYVMDHLDPAMTGSGYAPDADGTPVTLDNPAGNILTAARAVRVNVIARTPNTDVMASTNYKCNALRPQLRPLFTRPAVEDHLAPLAGTSSYCDGYRRTLYTQTMYLANMRASPL